MKKLRVVMVVRLFFPWIGGTEKQAYKLAKTLMKRGIEVEIVTGWWFRGTSQHEMIDGIPVFRNITLWEMFGIRGLRRFGGYLYIVTLLWYLGRNRNDYDIIHVHGLNYHTFACVLAGRWFNKPVIAKLANSGLESDIKKMYREQQLPLESYMLPTTLGCDYFLATTETIVEELTAEGVQKEKILQLPNGVETDVIRPKEDYGFDEDIIIAFVGRLHQQKGLDILLQGFNILLDKFPSNKIRLQIVGDGPLKSELMALVSRLGLDSKVDFVGKSINVFPYLEKTDIFVLPSRAEGLSNALLEAMAFGLPVIASNIPANKVLVQNEVTGLLFEVESADSLANALSSYLISEDLRRQMGSSARKLIETKYSLDGVSDRYIDLYNTLLD